MFDVGFQEIMLIFVILLIVVGPERLPKLARTLGLWLGKARTIVTSVKSEVEREIRVSELKQTLQEQAPTEEIKKLADQVKSINSDFRTAGQDIQKSLDKAASDINETESSSDSAPATTGLTPSTSATPDSKPSSTSNSPNQVAVESTPAPSTNKVSAE